MPHPVASVFFAFTNETCSTRRSPCTPPRSKFPPVDRTKHPQAVSTQLFRPLTHFAQQPGGRCPQLRQHEIQFVEHIIKWRAVELHFPASRATTCGRGHNRHAGAL
jgi:hypothetical protein